MSEIPLHTFGRNRKSRSGYTPLQNGEPGDDDHNDDHDHPEDALRRTQGTAAMALPSLRQIFAAFRSPEQEAELSRTAFSRFLAFILTCTGIAVLASRSVQKAVIANG